MALRNLSTPVVPVNEVRIDTDVTPENIIVIIIGIVAVLANGTLLYVMYKDPLKVFRSKISFLVMCLGTADMLTALNGVLYGFLLPLNMYHIALFYIFWITVMVSVLTISGMCVERWLAIFHPFKYNTGFTKRVTLYFCFGVWFLSGAIVSSIHFLPVIMPFILSSTVEALLFLIVVLYLAILLYFKRTQTNAVEKVVQNRNCPHVEESSGKNSGKFSKKTTETQLFIVVSILVLILFVTFIPYNMATQIHYGFLWFHERPYPPINVFRRYFFPFKFLNFLLNPFVYAWRLIQYRRSFGLVIWNWNKHGNTPSSSTNKATSENKGFSPDSGDDPRPKT